jgi:hypothetical protein
MNRGTFGLIKGERRERRWLRKKTMTMAQDLRGWGVGLIIMGVLHFVIPVLSPQWGMVLIPLGVLSLAIQHRGMFIALGASLILVGLLNIAATLQTGKAFWPVFGCLQIYWGFKEIMKFARYGKQAEEARLPEATATPE